jgi:hypothetical protein
LTEQQEGTKPEIVDQSTEFVFETSHTNSEAPTSSLGKTEKILIGGLVVLFGLAGILFFFFL